MPCSLAKCGEIILSHLQYFCFCSSQGMNYFQKMKMENWYLTRWISVTHGRWLQGGENWRRSQVRGNLLHFFHLWEWAVDHETQQFMNLRAGMLGLWGGNHCWNVYIEERNGKFWTMKTMHFSFHVICLLCFFMEEMAILQLMCWLSSVFSSWYSMLVLERDRVYWFFQHLFLFYCPFQVTVHHPSLPGPGEV